MKKKPVSRRDLLRGAAGAGISLPFLDVMAGVGPRASAQPAAFPKRFLMFHYPMGCPPPHWNPIGTETNFNLSAIASAPLAPHKQDLTVIAGLHNMPYIGPGANAHSSQLRQFTGKLCVYDPSLNWGCISSKEPDYVTLSAAGPTLDQQVIPLVGGNTTRFRSLQLGAGGGSCAAPTADASMSWADVGRPLVPEMQADVTFNRLFGSVGSTPGTDTFATLHRRRRSILDTVKEDFTTLNARLGTADRQRLEAHLEAIRAIEARLTTSPTAPLNCAAPVAPGTQITNANDYPGFVKLQLDLMVTAMACDLVRVGTFFAATPVSGGGSFTGYAGTWHNHWAPTDLSVPPELAKVTRWFSEQVAYLLTKLKSIPEGNGTMLDNTLVYFSSDMGYQTGHWMDDVPVVLAGKAGGAFRTGRFILNHNYAPLGTSTAQLDRDRVNRNSLNDLHRQILNLFGGTATTFGDPAYNKGPIPGFV